MAVTNAIQLMAATINDAGEVLDRTIEVVSQPVLSRAGVLDITAISKADAILSGKGNPLAVRSNNSKSPDGAVISNYIANIANIVNIAKAKAKAKRIAFLSQNDACGNGAQASIEAELKRLNWACEKVAEEKFPLAQADFRVAMTNVQAATPELTVAINANGGLGMPATTRQARQSRLPGKLKSAVGRVAPSGFCPQGQSGMARPLVAERLGATKGRTCHHDRSKADLYFVAAMGRVTEAIERIARRRAGAVERLSAMALRHAQILLTELPMQKVAVQGLERQLLVSTLASHSPAAKRLRAVVKMRDDYESLFAEGLFADVIDQGIREGLLIDLPPRLATKPFFGVLNWATVWYNPRRLQSPAAIDELAQLLAAYAMRGLLKPAAG